MPYYIKRDDIKYMYYIVYMLYIVYIYLYIIYIYATHSQHNVCKEMVCSMNLQDSGWFYYLR